MVDKVENLFDHHMSLQDTELQWSWQVDSTFQLSKFYHYDSFCKAFRLLWTQSRNDLLSTSWCRFQFELPLSCHNRIQPDRPYMSLATQHFGKYLPHKELGRTNQQDIYDLEGIHLAN